MGAKIEEIKNGNSNRFLSEQILFSNKTPNQKLFEILDTYKTVLNTLDPSIYYAFLEWKEYMLTLHEIELQLSKKNS